MYLYSVLYCGLLRINQGSEVLRLNHVSVELKKEVMEHGIEFCNPKSIEKHACKFLELYLLLKQMSFLAWCSMFSETILFIFSPARLPLHVVIMSDKP